MAMDNTLVDYKVMEFDEGHNYYENYEKDQHNGCKKCDGDCISDQYSHRSDQQQK